MAGEEGESGIFQRKYQKKRKKNMKETNEKYPRKRIQILKQVPCLRLLVVSFVAIHCLEQISERKEEAIKYVY